MLAQSHVARTDFASARAEYERAIGLIFKYRSTINNPELQASAASTRTAGFSRLRGPADARRRARGARQTASGECVGGECACARSSGRARSTFDARASLRSMSPPSARVDDLLARMAGKRVRMASLADRSQTRRANLHCSSSTSPSCARKSTGCAHGRTRCKGRRRITDGGSHRGRRCSGITQLSYALDTEHAYLLDTRRVGIRATVLAATPAVLDHELTTLQATIRNRESTADSMSCSPSSAELLPPGALSDDTNVLEIVAEGRVGEIPFAGLSSPGEPAPATGGKTAFGSR